MQNLNQPRGQMNEIKIIFRNKYQKQPMSKRKIIAFTVAIIVLIPVFVVCINKIASIFFNADYTDISEGAYSDHYQMGRINLVGFLSSHSADSKIIDTDSSAMEVDTLVFNADGSPRQPQSEKLHYVPYSGEVYLDTLQFVFKVETKEDVVNQYHDHMEGKSHFITFDRYGKILANRTDSNGNTTGIFRNCLLLENIIMPFQKWSDDKQPIYLGHFSREVFDSECLNPLRGWGSPNGAGTCYVYNGHAYMNIRIGDEQLKFKLPSGSKGILFTAFDEYSLMMSFSQVPERFHSKVNASFMVFNNYLYMARLKAV